MQIPLDRVCVKSGILCDKCKAKVDSGLYKQWEVDVMRALLELEPSYKELRAASYVKSVIIDNVLYVMLDKVTYVSRGLAKALEDKLKNLNIKGVRVISYGGDPRQLLSNLLSSANVMSVGTYYAPDGSAYYVVKVPASERGRVSEVEQAAKAIFKSLTSYDLFIEYDKTAVSERTQSVVSRLDKDKLSEALKRIGA